MPRYVIDTNVAIVANQQEANVKSFCQEAAIRLLLKATQSGQVYLDSAGEIQNEYRRYLNPKGQPGVGDRFYLAVINSHPQKVSRVDVLKCDNGEYEDVPQPIIDAGFDPSDRKFIAVAVKANAKVHNATDSDWVEQKDVIEANGVKVEFLCGCDPAQWYHNK